MNDDNNVEGQDQSQVTSAGDEMNEVNAAQQETQDSQPMQQFSPTEAHPVDEDPEENIGDEKPDPWSGAKTDTPTENA